MPNQQTINVLLIEDNPEFAILVESWLGDEGKGRFTICWRETLASGLQRLRDGGIDVILLDLGLSDSDGTATFATLRESAAAIPLLVLSGDGGEALAVQMIREGAEDYLAKSSCTAEGLIRALRFALTRHISRVELSNVAPPTRSGKVVGLIGSKGGVGTTTVACSLAADLARETGEKVVVCDLDFYTGTVAFLAGVASEYSILDAAENLERLDDSYWQKIVKRGQNGIDIVGSPLFHPAAKVDAKKIGEVLFRIRRYYGWIVLDLGRQSRDASLLCERVDELLLVTTTAVSSLYEAKRFCGSISQTSINRERMRIVVNELNKDQKLSRADWTSAFGNPVCGVLPPDGAELHKAALERRPPQESSSFRKEMMKVARSVASLPESRAKRAAPPLFSWRSPLETGRA